MNLIDAIITRNHIEARRIIAEMIEERRAIQLAEFRKRYVAEHYDMDEDEIQITPELVMEAPRIKIVRARIRNGKVQRRKRVSTVSGFTMRKKGKGPARLIRMSPVERRKRKMGQKRGKIKRRAKLSRFRMRLKRANVKRRALGIR